MEIRPLNATHQIGAEVYGIELNGDLAENALLELQNAWKKHKVLIFPNQTVSDAEQVAFSQCFGELEKFPLTSVQTSAHPEIFRVSNVDESNKRRDVEDDTWRYIKVTQSWHIDSSYRAVPSRGSLLRALELTRQGGETWFCNLQLAFDDLPSRLKNRVTGLRAIHDFEISRKRVGKLPPLGEAQKVQFTPTSHPLVRIDPTTGVPSLYLSPGHTSHIEGLSSFDSAQLLEELVSYSTRDEYIYRHRWWPGDLVMWENDTIMHYAQPFDDRNLRRVMHRTTLAGTAPVLEFRGQS